MNDLPHAAELLATACDALTAEILPALPQELRYTGLMIANAMAIAQREIAAGDAAARAEHNRLQNLYSEPVERLAGDTLHSVLASYNRRLAEGIRAGKFDGQLRSAMLEHLRRTTGEKVAVSNPKALPGKNRSKTKQLEFSHGNTRKLPPKNARHRNDGQSVVPVAKMAFLPIPCFPCDSVAMFLRFWFHSRFSAFVCGSHKADPL